MGILVTAKIVSTSGPIVTYSFSDGNGREGRFNINSSNGDLVLQSPMPNDYSKTFFARAARKVVLDWRENGRLPEKSVWSS